MIEFEKQIGPVHVSVDISRTSGWVTLGNPYRTGEKFGIIWRVPRLQIGKYTNAQYGWRDPYMNPHKHNIRIGS